MEQETQEVVRLGGQTALLDLSAREFNIMFVDETQPLQVAVNPLHWRLHKLQIAAARMENQADRNPAQYNSTTYIATIDKMAELMEQINKQEPGGNEILGSQFVVGSGNAAGAPGNGQTKSISMDS